jgi:hypothetical protein
MRLRLRISRAILLISLSIIFLAMGVEASFSYAAYQRNILSYTQRQTEITFAIASALQGRVQESSSTATRLIPANLQIQTNSSRLTILKRDGSVLEEQPARAALEAASPDFTNQILEEGFANRWKPGGNILETGVALAQDGSSAAAVLIREVDLSQDLAHDRMEIIQRIAGALLMSALIGLLIFMANKRLTTVPMKQMQEVQRRSLPEI